MAPEGNPPSARGSFRRSCLVLCALGAVLAVLNGYLFPPALVPDSGKYVALADEIARIYGAEGSLTRVPEKFRMLGYPVLIAFLKHHFGDGALTALYALQAGLAIVSGIVLLRVFHRLAVSPLISLPLILLYLAAFPLMLSSFVLTDALNNALTAIAVAVLATPLFDRTRSVHTRRLWPGCAWASPSFCVRRISISCCASCPSFSPSPGSAVRSSPG
ncbi:MAG: hypothetical protein Kow0032_17320 [Methyloligellaceae bacterium]